MRIPFQDSRADKNRRWTDYKRLSKIRFFEIYEILEGCQELNEIELMELSGLIDGKLKAFQQFSKGKTALSTKGESQREAAVLGQHSTVITASAKIFQNFFWRWYEKLASIGGTNFNPDSKNKDRQNPYKWPFY